MELKGEIEMSTITVGGFNTSLSAIERTTVQKISKDIKISNNIINKQDLTDIVEHSTQQQHITHSFQASMEHFLRWTTS